MSRILYIVDVRPTSGYGGGERTLSIYNALRKIADVDLLLVAMPGSLMQAEPGEHFVRLLADTEQATRWYWRKHKYLLKDFRPNERVRAVLSSAAEARGYDAYFGRYHFPLMADCARFGPSFVDVDDLPMDTWTSRVPLFDSVRRFAFFNALSDFKTVFVTKNKDVGRIKHPDVRVLPCISTLPEKTGPALGESESGRMLFVGGLEWSPNRAGIQQFIDKSLPRIRERVPDALLRVVGRNGADVAGPRGVSAAGFVPDLLPEYVQASVVVCPIRSGSGSIVKLAEAAAYGKPIVATRFAARGFEGILDPGRDFLVADSDEEFSDACVKLLGDGGLRATLSANIRKAAAGRLDQLAIDNGVRAALEPWLPD
ncbi:MAG: glycosyltransferase family 4 protein [Pseudomonadota bacterium]